MKAIFLTLFILITNAIYPVTIYLRDVSYAHGNVIELSEIAFIQGENVEKWEKLIIGKTSKEPQVLTATQIKEKIDSAKFTDASYTIIGNQTKVITPFTIIAQYELEVEIKKAIEKLFPTDWSRTHLIFNKEINDIDIPLGNYRIIVNIQNSEILYGQKNISVQIFLDDRLYQTISTTVIIQGRIRVLFARKEILPDKNINFTDAVHNEIILQQDLSNYIFSASELAGYVSVKYIPQGSPILRSALKKKIIIKQTQEIEAVFKSGSVVVFADAIAENEGGIGDIITIKTKFNGRTYKGIIVGQGKVEIRN